MATLAQTRPPLAPAVPRVRIPWRPLAILGAVLAANLLLYYMAVWLFQGLDAGFVHFQGDKIPDTGRDALHKLLWVGDACIGLWIAGEFLGGRTRYFLTRLAVGILTVFLITTAVYFLLTVLPGEKWYSHLINGKNQSEAAKQAILHHYGLDRPLIVQYLTYINQLLQFPPDLGYSTPLHDTVWNAIKLRAPQTFVLMGTSYVVQIIIAIPIGVISAVRPYGKLDNAVTFFSFFGISIPNFWLGSMLLYLLVFLPISSGGSKIFPAGQYHSNLETPLLSDWGDLAWHLVLPVIVLAVQGIASYARYTRSAMLDVLGLDYIRTARAKGLSGYAVVMKHAFRNSLLPVITLAGLDIPQLFAGAIITETVFNWQGMGQVTVNEADSGDLIFVVGVLVVLAVLVVVGNLIADLAYTIADPRISYGKRA